MNHLTKAATANTAEEVSLPSGALLKRSSVSASVPMSTSVARAIEHQGASAWTVAVRRAGMSLSAVVASLTIGCGTVLSGGSLSNSQFARNDASTHGSSIRWSNGGLVALSRPLPERSDTSSGPLLGFMPTGSALTSDARPFVDGTWIKVSSKSGSISLMNGSDEVAGSKGTISTRLTPGTYRVVHRQQQPLWYAPDSYFSSRKLPVPAAGSKARYLRGALGDAAVYLDSELAIHDSTIWCDEVGGIRVDSAMAQNILKNAQPGSLVVVE